MFERALFLKGVGSALVATALPSPTPSTQPSATPDDNNGLCEKNPTLPTDRPLELTIRVLDGKDFDLMKYRGNVVWMNIFATWCGPCNFEQPNVVALAAKYHDRGLRVIGVDFAETDDTVRAYRKKFAIPYPLAMDEDGTLTNAMDQNKKNDGNVSFPGHLLIDRNGFLACYRQGSLTIDEVESEILALLGPEASPTPVA